MNPSDEETAVAKAAVGLALDAIGIDRSADIANLIVYLSKGEPDQEAQQLLAEHGWEIVSTLE